MFAPTPVGSVGRTSGLPFTFPQLQPGRGRRLRKLACFGLGLVGAIQFLPWRVGVVQGASMAPTFEPGDVFVYSRPVLPVGPLRRGDVVILRHQGETWIKRVYAAGGDSFWNYYENDGEVRYHLPILASERERFDRLAVRVNSGKATTARVFKMRIPAGKVFVMGDSSVSEDSRTLGAFDADEVVGRVVAVPGRELSSIPAEGWGLSWVTPAKHAQAVKKSEKADPAEVSRA